MKTFFKSLVDFLTAVIAGGFWAVIIMGGAVLCWFLMYAIVTGAIRGFGA